MATKKELADCRGDILRRWDEGASQYDLAREFDSTQSDVSRVLRTWTKAARGKRPTLACPGTKEGPTHPPITRETRGVKPLPSPSRAPLLASRTLADTPLPRGFGDLPPASRNATESSWFGYSLLPLAST